MTNHKQEQELIDRLVRHDSLPPDVAPTTNSPAESSSAEYHKFSDTRDFLDHLNHFARNTAFPDGNDMRCSAVPAAEQDSNAAHANEPFLPRSIGRFEVIDQIGIGGFGIVIHAYDPKLDREVAIKILRPESLLIESNRLRFEREAQLAANLNHPGIVPVFETGIDGPIRFIVFGFVPGIDLATWLSTLEQALPIRVVTSLLEHITDAVAHAHRHGILHRDLKPGNLLIHQTSDAPVAPSDLAAHVIVADFGLAIELDGASRLTGTGAMVGTPVYTAPELFTGNKQPSPASDVYALGIILYELLAGRPPFMADSNLKLLRSIAEEQPARFRHLGNASNQNRPRVSRDLEAICFKCLQKNPLLRYPSAVELHEDLLRLRRGQPVQARPVTAISELWRWATGNPFVATLLSTIAVLLLLLVTGSVWTAFKLNHKNNHLEHVYFESLINEIQLHRRSQLAGRKTRALDAARSALPILRNEDPREIRLRNEVMASIQLSDIERVSRFPVPEFDLTHPERISFNPSLKQAALAQDNQVLVLDLITGDRFTLDSPGSPRKVLFVDEERLLVMLEHDNSQWELSCASIATRVFSSIGKYDCPVEIAPSSNGSFLVWDGRVRVFDRDSKPLHQWELHHRELDGIKLSPSGKKLAAWHGNVVEVWDVNKDNAAGPIHRFEHRFNPSLEITSVSWSHDESTIASTTSAFSTHLWSLAWGESRHQELAGHNGWVYRAFFDRHRPALITSSSDATSRFWNHENGQLQLVSDGMIVATNASADRFAGINQNEILIWRISPVKFRKSWVLDETCGCLLSGYSGDSSSDSRKVLIADADQFVLLDGKTRDALSVVPGGENLDVAFSGDGQVGFGLSAHRLVKWNDSGKRTTLLKDYPQEFVSGALSVNSDGTKVVLATQQQQFVFDCLSQTFQSSLTKSIRFGFSRFHPTQSILAIPEENGVSLLDTSMNKTTGFLPNVQSPIRFSPDGSILIGQCDGSLVATWLDRPLQATIWNSKSSLEKVGVAFSADGKLLAVSGLDKHLKLFQVHTTGIKHVLDIPCGTRQTWVTFVENRLICGDPEQYVIEFQLGEIRTELSKFGLDW